MESSLSTALKPHSIVATADRKKRMVIQMLALFCCDHALSMIVYNQMATIANMIQNTTHLIVVVMAFDLLLSEIKIISLCRE
jgi:hypothetical protein